MGFLDTIATKVALQRAGLGGVSLPKDNPFAGNSKGTQDGAGNGGMANPFANMQWPPKAFSSWQAPPVQAPIRDAPIIGEKAQSSPKLQFPTVDARPVVVLFLRYCGCPFTEKLFIKMRSLANRHTSIHFIAVSHCTEQATKDWVNKVGGSWNVDVVVDQSRDLYALWGLGVSNWGHLLNPRNGYNQVLLGKNEGVWGQQVGEGGCRWQTGGAYAVDERGFVKWGGPMKSVDEAIVFEEAVAALGR
ncbi:hypothetical protein HBI56_134440 [Parastagonospora nodorum]|uniref:Thioredoxin domain-containing protein n=1 Tax=Phaeosphaeria nodorum (strain SN15 / ATCC MYA-4574 / FGSC 10173) TaxID=321614 RepID=A0A7U2I5C2_PHANO|nr:hypothetical protein HBH56_037540 [Parastagonospora nodorum]QRC99942.1 hypothetical protein JI435_068650 [Parastagonospora nodorum SN15]KAH3933998.1 hypothetical protein HBH54_061940 [Parastagonospora nodorum]KAH4001857.1 hypothetical protein HBI10_078910 [Parastagonospora nodorum]KAH4032043.1 hypothetical protein HBI13_019300 [Parastagonospora nodorum]